MYVHWCINTKMLYVIYNRSRERDYRWSLAMVLTPQPWGYRDVRLTLHHKNNDQFPLLFDVTKYKSVLTGIEDLLQVEARFDYFKQREDLMKWFIQIF